MRLLGMLVLMVCLLGPRMASGQTQATCEIGDNEDDDSDNMQTKDRDGEPSEEEEAHSKKKTQARSGLALRRARKWARDNARCEALLAELRSRQNSAVEQSHATGLSALRPAEPVFPLVAPRPLRRTRVQWDVEDFNGDGLTDSVIPTAGTQLRLQFGLPNGTLGTAQIRQVPGALISAVRARDENRDGRQDLIFCCATISGQFQAGILLGNGDGTFQDPRPAAPADQNLQSMFWSGDWNRDGRGDVMVAAPGPTPRVNLALGRGDGTFEPPRLLTIPACTQRMIEADLNADSRVDLVLGCDRQVVILPQQQDGSIGAPTTLTLDVPRVNYLLAADWNRDGRDDLAMMDTFAGVLQAYLSRQNGTYQLTGPVAIPAGFEGAWLLAESPTKVPALLVPNPTARRTKLVLLADDGGLFAPALLPKPPVNFFGLPWAVADFAGDGRPEVALAAGTQIRLFRFPASALRPERAGDSTAPAPIQHLEAADFTGDQRPDLLASTGNRIVMLRNANGVFTAATETPIAGQLGRFVLADFTGDGRLDVAGIVTDNASAGRVSVLPGNGQGGFGAALNLTFLSLPSAVTAGDWDGDGRVDLAVLSSENFGVTQGAVFWNQGNGTFSAAQRLSTPTTGFGGGAIASGDVNGDGRTDLLVAGIFSGGTLSVQLGQPGRQFQAVPLQGGFESLPSALLVRDQNGDGRADLIATACCGETATTVHWGRGDGTFGAGFPIFGVTNTTGIRLADVDGDNRPEALLSTDAGVAVADTRLIPPSTAQVSAASSLPVIARNSIVSAYGTHLATATAGATALNQLEIAGTTVSIRTTSQIVECPLFFVSPGQVNYLIPASVSDGPVTVTISSGDGQLSVGEMNVQRVAPGLFLAGATPFVAANVIRVQPDGTQRREEVLNQALAPIPVDVSNPAEKVVLVLFGTGIRGRTALGAVSVRVGGAPVTVEFAGAQGTFAGLDQINVVLPASLAGRGDVPVEVTVDGVAANVGRIAIR